MTKTSKSNERMLNALKDKSLAEISIIQSAYARKDTKTLKQLFNKPNLQDSSILALGNLSNQYINTLHKPNKKFTNQIKKKYNIQLDTSNTIQAVDTNIKLINATKTKKQKITSINPIKISIYPFINFSISVKTLYQYVNYESIDSLEDEHIQDIKQTLITFFHKFPIRMKNYNAQTNIAHIYKHIRVIIEFKKSDNSIEFVSTKISKFHLILKNLIKLLYDMYITTNYYMYDKSILETMHNKHQYIKSIQSVVFRYYY